MEFQPVNSIFNVMKACMGDKHQVVIKIVKQLDSQMVRDITVKTTIDQWLAGEDSDGAIEIPKPTFATGDGDSEPDSPEKEEPKTEKKKQPFMPSLADNCIKIISNNLCIENAL